MDGSEWRVTDPGPHTATLDLRPVRPPATAVPAMTDIRRPVGAEALASKAFSVTCKHMLHATMVRVAIPLCCLVSTPGALSAATKHISHVAWVELHVAWCWCMIQGTLLQERMMQPRIKMMMRASVCHFRGLRIRLRVQAEEQLTAMATHFLTFQFTTHLTR